jgi:hypothetical protein
MKLRGYDYVGELVQATGNVLHVFRHKKQPERVRILNPDGSRWHIHKLVLEAEARGSFQTK